jgi:hypothetical protein
MKKCSGKFSKTSRSGPHGTNIPMGRPQHKQQSRISARPLRPRDCLRQGCGRVYHPTRWNQRYCQQAACRREVRRWQAAKRQRAHRQLPDNRKRHAEAEAKRRRDRTAQTARNDPVADKTSTGQDRAWSRSKEIFAEFCGRPGCYEPLPDDSRAPARYCGRDCRRAVRRVLDRERKWLTRNRYHAGRDRRGVSQTAREPLAKRQPVTTQKTRHDDAKPVGDYRGNQQNALSCQAVKRHPPPPTEQGTLRDGHCKTNPDRRSRPPPA